jgi:outer membrane lipase/esterase
MTLFRDLRRIGARLLAPTALVALLLAACGGDSEQVEAFVPARLIVLGDENSIIDDDPDGDGIHDADGFKYTINDRRGTGTGKCRTESNIVQYIATQYNFVFAECNPAGVTPRAFIHARVGATVDHPLTGLEAQRASVKDLGPSDMVSVMIGTNDIIEVYELVRAGKLPGNDPIGEIRRRGKVAADQISAVLATGARALVMTVPDVSLSPYAFEASKTDSGAKPFLHDLSYEYNGSLRTSIVPNDGRNYGLVLADDIVTAMYQDPTTYLDDPSVVNFAACTTIDVRNCQITDSAATTTLVSGATASNFLWAGDRHLSPEAHMRIGQQAQVRAVNNPF